MVFSWISPTRTFFVFCQICWRWWFLAYFPSGKSTRKGESIKEIFSILRGFLDRPRKYKPPSNGWRTIRRHWKAGIWWDDWVSDKAAAKRCLPSGHKNTMAVDNSSSLDPTKFPMALGVPTRYAVQVALLRERSCWRGRWQRHGSGHPGTSQPAHEANSQPRGDPPEDGWAMGK